MDFDTLLRKPKKTQAEQILIQCIAALSTKPGYTDKTPQEVFETQRKFAEEVGY